MHPIFDSPLAVRSYVETCGEALWQHAEETTDVSLLGGKAGLTLFYGHLYHQLGREQDFERLSWLLEDIIGSCAEAVTNHSLSRGTAGIAWVIQHGIRMGLLDESTGEALEGLEQSMESSLYLAEAERDYDLFTGLLGIATYFLECPPTDRSTAVLEQCVKALAAWAVPVGNYQSWLDQQPKGEVYNLGMAHGIPSIIAFLSKAHRRNVNSTITAPLLEAAVGGLLAQKLPFGSSQFPHFAGIARQSRLAWCYGDLGPALALYHASKALNRPDWRQQAIDIALHAALRDRTTAGISKEPAHEWPDTGFCHGTAGIGHIFHRFYQATGQAEFRQQAQYWLSLTATPFLPIDQGIAGQLHPNLYEATPNWIPHVGLLEGMTGVGMVLLSALDETMPRWDAIFHTDIA